MAKHPLWLGRPRPSAAFLVAWASPPKPNLQEWDARATRAKSCMSGTLVLLQVHYLKAEEANRL